MADEGPWTQYAQDDGPWTQYRKPIHTDYDATGSTADRFLAGAGKAFVDLGRGAEQIGAQAGEKVGLVSPETTQNIQQGIDESRVRDAPLMKTTAGKVGNVVGGVAAYAPAALIPGVNTFLGAAALGAGMGALQPTATGESKGANVALGAASGVAGKAVGDVAAKGLGYVADKLGRVRAAAPASAAQEAVTAGYKIPPSLAKAKPSLIDDFLEGLAGKTRTAQAASIPNEENSTNLIRQGLGLDEGSTLTKAEIREVRSAAGNAYNVVKSIPGEMEPKTADLDRIVGVASKVAKKYPGVFKNDQIEEMVDSLKQPMSAEDAVEIVKKLRLDGGANAGARDGQTRALGVAQKRAAQIIDDTIEKHVAAANQPEIYDAYITARQTIAKSYDAERALTPTNKINAVKMAQLGEKHSLSDEFEQVAKFGRLFRDVARDTGARGSRLGPGISKTEFGAGLVGAAVGHPGAVGKLATAAAVTGAPRVARSYLLSDFAQQGMFPPSRTLEQSLLPRAGEIVAPQLLRSDRSQE